MKKTLFLLFINASVLAQKKLTYYEHIQPIIAKNCAVCHRPGGVGPFSLLTYEEVAKRAEFVAKVTQIRYMPPFPADRSFQHYANERGLKAEEIEWIQQWVAQGSEEGKKLRVGSAQVTVGNKEVRSSLTDRKTDLVL